MNRVLINISIVVTAFLMTSCAYTDAGIGYAEGKAATTINQIKRVNNIEAGLLVQAPCAMDIGAYYRVLNPVQQRAVSALCGGSVGNPITVEDLVTMNQILGLARGIPPVTTQPLLPPAEPEAPVTLDLGGGNPIVID